VTLRPTRIGARLLDQTLGSVPVVLVANGTTTSGRRLRGGTTRWLSSAEQTLTPPPALGPLFAPYGAELTASGRRYLAHVARRLGTVTAVECRGHVAPLIEGLGATPFSDRLGRARGAAACAALKRAGLRAARFVAASAGKDDPRGADLALDRYVTLVVRRG
jgi:hypothetical protein